jgi:hypothetical protein
MTTKATASAAGTVSMELLEGWRSLVHRDSPRWDSWSRRVSCLQRALESPVTSIQKMRVLGDGGGWRTLEGEKTHGRNERRSAGNGDGSQRTRQWRKTLKSTASLRRC